MNQDREATLERLLDLICRLYAQTEGFLENPADLQLWYNRDYASGVLAALRELGYAQRLATELDADPDGVVSGHEGLPWGQAYRHGVPVGSRETREVLI